MKRAIFFAWFKLQLLYSTLLYSDQREVFNYAFLKSRLDISIVCRTLRPLSGDLVKL